MNKQLIALLTIGVITACQPIAAPAREKFPGQFAQVDPETKAWFRGLKSKRTNFCCDESDCSPTQFRMQGSKYVAYIKEWDQWLEVPDDAVVTDEEKLKNNPTGGAVVCFMGGKILCFVPGNLY